MVERVRDLAERGLGAGAGHPLGEHRGLRRDALGRAARHHQRRHGGLDGLGGLRRGDGRFLDDDVGVGAAEAERRDAGAARPPGLRPLGRCVHDFEAQVVERDVRVRLLVAEVGRDRVVLQGEHGLGEPGDTGGRLEVPEVRLHRTQQQRALRGPALAQYGAQGAGLDRIAQQRAGAVRLDVVHLAGLDARGGVRRAQHRHLGGRVRGHQSVGAAVLVDRRTADHREDPVTVALGVGEPLEDCDAAALAADEPVGGGVERVALPRLGHRLELVEAAGHRRRQQQVHPGGQREVRIARAQALAGQVDRHQRGRTRGVDGHRGPAQVEVVRHPVGDDRQRTAGARPGVHIAEVDGRQVAVLPQARCGEHPGLGVPQAVRLDAGVLERLLGDLQQQSLLRVHLVGLAGRDLEELRVEGVDVAQERPPPGGSGERRGGLGRVHREGLPPVGRNLADRGTALGEELPVGVRPLDVAVEVGATGEAAAQADHRDRLVAGHVLGANGRGGGLDDRFDLPAGQELGERVDRGVLPELHRRDGAAEQLGELTGEHDGIARTDGEVVERCVEIDLVGAAPDVGDQIVDQPVPQGVLVESRGHVVMSNRLNSSWR
ncbi:hypothetical protein MCHUDSM44219_01402 [Mycolicibacterium chubuense]|uniref:Uncharacterized protein n=1 Tax=Mycolicibacterium chubuense TaxID=1800 RepID=A0A0J6WKJ7_MYCCU|nr:hypothetical protein MCHUDSM44219_01402 [Mycolicibacterium chubuense]